MKKLLIALLCAAALLIPAAAHAFAVYNHVDCTVSVTKNWHMGVPIFTVPAHGTHNGEQGAGLDNVYVWWVGSKAACYGSENFSIPKGGFARIYKSNVKIYDHQNKHLHTVSVSKQPCN